MDEGNAVSEHQHIINTPTQPQPFQDVRILPEQNYKEQDDLIKIFFLLRHKVNVLLKITAQLGKYKDIHALTYLKTQEATDPSSLLLFQRQTSLPPPLFNFTSILCISTRAGCPSDGRFGSALIKKPPGPNRAQI